MKILKNILQAVWKHKVATAIVLVLVLVVGFIFRPKGVTPIATQKIEMGNITQTVSVSGSVMAKNTAVLSFPIGGTISWIGPKVGDTVQQWQTIATLDQRTALKNLQQALIAYNEQRITFDQTIANNNGIQNPNDALNQNMKWVLENNQYDLTKAVNSVELQNLAAQQAVLTTPIAGIVTNETTQVAGTTALAGTTTFTVTDPNSVVFSMDVDEADIGKIRLGQEVQLTLDAYPNQTLTLPITYVDFVSHTTTSGGNAFAVQIKLPINTNYMYRVGMNGNADILTATRDHVLTVPLASLIGNNQIYVKTAKGFMKKTVTLGLQSDTDAQVVSGLKQGDIIALDPTQVSKSQ